MPSLKPPSQKPVLSRATLGVCCCALAAVSYTATNACLRQLSDMPGVNPIWATCVKESFAFSFAGLWILLRIFRGRPVLPPKKEFGILLVVGLAVQLVGNLGVIWAMGKIGLAVTIPTNYGALLLSSALFGRLILGERVSLRSMMALGLLMVALVLLGFGANDSAKAMAAANSASLSGSVVLAVTVSCLAGVVYAVLSIAMRHSSKIAIPRSAVLVIIASMGMLTLWPMSFLQVGTASMLATPPKALAWMLAAGVFNLIGFLGIAKGLELTTVVHANVLNASQVAMCAVVGMAFFQESGSSWLISGVILTLLGIMLIDRPPTAAETVETAV